uniref:Uncharacterized protein n=1 Tax=Avena sativa TaxID=4498 RepID=A0ACD6ASD6_AVESA
MLACTHPSRVASMSLSVRVAEEMDAVLGQEIGYRVPFENCTSDRTVLKFLTESVLVREAMVDPLLKKYRVVIIDEAHVLTQETEVLCCSIMENALKQRPEMKLIVMSSGHDAASFRIHFAKSVLMKVTDNTSAVGIYYAPHPVESYVGPAIETTIDIHMWEPSGSILVFLTSQADVQYACWKLSKKLDKLRNMPEDIDIGPVEIVPIYAALSLEMQRKIFEPPQVIWKVGAPQVRKIFVSTGVAEASLPINGIVYVIDSGLSYRKVCTTPTWAEKRCLAPIPMARAKQRAALAGGTQSGRCYRLYTQQDFNHLPQHIYPESDRRNLGNTVLILKNLGVSNLKKGFLHPPPVRQSFEAALKGLSYLGALDENGNLSALGYTMCEFPVDVQMANMILASVSFSCSNEILSIAAMLLVPYCFIRPMEAVRAADEAKEQFMHGDGDHITLLNVYNDYLQSGQDTEWCKENYVNIEVMKSAQRIREQLACLMTRFSLKQCSPMTMCPWYYNNIKMSILSGYFMQVAHKESSGLYRMVKDNQNISRRFHEE